MNPHIFDSLSSPLKRLLTRPHAYRQLVVDVQQRQPPEQRQAVALLEQLTPATLVGQPLRRHDEAQCALAGLWLWIDELDRSHTISQRIPTPSGSFWHAIVHRREGDLANSRYWYARCVDHPVLRMQEAQHEAVRANGTAPGRDGVIVGAALVDLVEQAIDAPADDALRQRAVELQRREWQLLFDYCIRAAAGR